jgi:4-carboxymuconolactone decarboxylase
MPRLDPITSNSALSPQQQAAGDAVIKVFGRIRGPFSMLLHSPQLAERLLPMVTFVREDTIVGPANLRFAAILTAAREREAAYVWAAQVEQAHKHGVRKELVDLIRAKGDPGALPQDEREIVNYVRQLMRNNRADTATFDALKAKYSAQWLVELTAIVQFFGFVSGICNAFEVPPPENGDRF